jgi:hypothetical protein
LNFGAQVRAESYGSNNTSSSVTLTASSTPGASNLSLYGFGAQMDTPFVAQPTISGWTTLANPVPGAYVSLSLFYKQGNTTAALTQTGLGTSVAVSGGVILEISATASTSHINLGVNPVTTFKVGTSSVSKVMIGTNQAWP